MSSCDHCEDVKAIRKDIAEIKIMIEKMNKSSEKLDEHIDFVEHVYTDVIKSPVNWIMNGSSNIGRYITGSG